MKKIIINLISLLFCAMSIIAQNSVKISGTVVDETNSPVFGASVQEKGTTNGASTDEKGAFSLTVSGKNAVVTITYLGYQPYELKYTTGSVTIKLIPRDVVLQEAVVVGYGQQKKASVTAAISQVKAEDLQKSGVPNMTNAIAGRVAGVITVMGSGQPGSDDSQIFIRGMSTTNAADPLVLVDGVQRDWQQVDPEDVESFSVLKDASATAVYGVRGANGVILISTKRGMVGAPKVTVAVRTSIQQPIRLPKFLDSYGYATLYNEALKNDGSPPAYSESDLMHYKLGDSPYTHPNNDLYKDFVNPASWMEKFNLNVNGGTDVMKYYIAAEYLHQEGMYKSFKNAAYNTNSNFNRLNLRSNLDFNVTKHTLVSFDLTGRLEVRQQPNFGDNLFNKIVRIPPNYNPYINPDGSLGGRSDETRLTPYALLSQYGNQNHTQNTLEVRLEGKEKMDYITKGLSFRVQGGLVNWARSKRDIYVKPTLYYYDRFGNYTLNRTFEPYSIQSGTYSAGNPSASYLRDITFEASFNYDRTFGEHAVTAMALYNQQQKFYDYSIPTGYLGYVGRITYSYKQRYLAEVNAGYNGSMQFSAAHRYGFFPSASLGWVVSDESFLKDNPVVSFLKIRLSYGEVGNDKIGNYKYFYKQVYNQAPSSPTFQWNWGETGPGSYNGFDRGYIEGMFGNDNVTWERARKYDVGFDSHFLDHKLTLTADYFYERRTDILAIPYSYPLVLGMNVPQKDPRSDGQGLPPQNLGIVHNQGFDGEIAFNQKIKDGSFFIKANFTYAHNVIDKIDEVGGAKYPWQTQVGKSIGTHFGYTDIGLFQVSDFITDAQGNLVLTGGYPTLKEGVPMPTMGAVWPGDCRYKDLNGDGVIDSYDIGAIRGTNVPEIVYGINVGGNYKDFDLNVLFQGAAKGWMYLNNDAVWEFNADGKVTQFQLGRYIPDDPSTWETATYPRLHASPNANNQIKTTRWLFNRNYLRLKNFEIGYNVPRSLISKLKLNKFRVFVNGTNLLCWDKLMNFDPENTYESGNEYPQFRTWTAGIDITF